jgi:hypothetical protein
MMTACAAQAEPVPAGPNIRVDKSQRHRHPFGHVRSVKSQIHTPSLPKPGSDPDAAPGTCRAGHMTCCGRKKERGLAGRRVGVEPFHAVCTDSYLASSSSADRCWKLLRHEGGRLVKQQEATGRARGGERATSPPIGNAHRQMLLPPALWEFCPSLPTMVQEVNGFLIDPTSRDQAAKPGLLLQVQPRCGGSVEPVKRLSQEAERVDDAP